MPRVRPSSPRRQFLVSLGLSILLLFSGGLVLAYIIIPGFANPGSSPLVVTSVSSEKKATPPTHRFTPATLPTTPPPHAVVFEHQAVLTAPTSDGNLPSSNTLALLSQNELETLRESKLEPVADDPEVTPDSASVAVASATAPVPVEKEARCPIPRKVREFIVSRPSIRKRIPPHYPSGAMEQGEEGTIRISATITESGTVESPFIAASSGHARLDAAALSAVRKWTFHPAKTNSGNLVACQTVIPITFRLQ